MAHKIIIDFLNRHKSGRILLVSHQRPDGDALGSCCGLARVLATRGFDAALAAPSPVPANLRFLLRDVPIAEPAGGDWWRPFDCVGLLDCGDIDRVDAANQAPIAALPTFNIDHHISSGGVGQAVWNDTTASSTGEMAVRLCRATDWPLGRDAATALWTAIITDTGRFSFENATAPALEAARECILAGAEPSEVARLVYQSVGVPERRLQRRILERMELTDGGRLASAWLTDADFVEAGVGVEGVQDLITLLRDTAGVEAAALFYEMTDADGRRSVKASLRTASPHDAVAIVSRYGGGGHTRAAGCSLDKPLTEAMDEVLGAMRREYFAVGR